MAIGFGTPTYFSGDVARATSTVTIDAPSSVVAGEVVFVIVSWSWDGGSDTPVTISGFTQLGNTAIPSLTNGFSPYAKVFYKESAGSEPGTYTIDKWTTGGGTTTNFACTAFKLSAVDGDDLIAGSSPTWAGTAQSTSQTLPSVTPDEQPGAFVWVLVNQRFSSPVTTTVTTPAGTTEIAYRSDVFNFVKVVYEAFTSTSASGTRTATIGPTGPGTPGAAMALAFREVAVSGVSGTATAALGFTASASAVRTVLGTAARSFGGTATAVGVRAVTATAASTITFTATAAGAADDNAEEGTATAAVGFTATAAGTVTRLGTAATTVTFAAAASGGSTQTGAAAAAIGFTATAQGVVTGPAGVPFLVDELGPTSRMTVELAFGADLNADSSAWTWTDVTEDVRADPGIDVTLGRGDEASHSQPAQCNLVLDNTTSAYSLGGHCANWPYVRRNTPVRVRIDPFGEVITDTFTRTVADSWGISDTNQAYATSGGGGAVSNADYDVSGGVGTHTCPTGAGYRSTIIDGVSVRDVQARVRIKFDFTNVTGDEMGAGIVLRRPVGGGDDGYLFQVTLRPDETVELWVYDLTGGFLGGTATGITHTTANQYHLRVAAGGERLLGRVWLEGASEPTSWQIDLTNSNHLTAGEIGLRTGFDESNTNKPTVVSFDNFRVASWSPATVFFGFADGFTPAWDALTGAIPVVNLSASGTLRRLAQGSAPVESALRRAIIAAPSVVAYWPFEEGEGSTLAKNLRGGTDFSFSGEPDWGASDVFDGSAALPTMRDSYFNAGVNAYPATGENQVTFLLYVPPDGLPDGTVLAHIHTTGSLSRFDITYEAGDGLLGVFIYNRDGSLNSSSPTIGFAVNGERSRISFEIRQSGSDVVWFLAAIGAVPGSVPGGFGNTISSDTCGVVSHIELAPHSDAGDAVMGHVTVANDVTSLTSLLTPLVAFFGESATAASTGRFFRLGAENNVDINVHGSAESLTLYDQMGPQRVAPLLELLHEAETSDQGTLWDGRVDGLSYTTRRYRELGTAPLVIQADQLYNSFDPVDDDQRTRNRVSATRVHGVTATYEDADGPMGTATIGTYDTSLTVNNAHDVMAIHYAAWGVRLGTTPGYRYPTLSLNARTVPHLVEDILRVIPGDRINIEGLSDTLTGFHPGTVSQIVEGISHTITPAEWIVTFRCSPFSPWGIARIADETGDGSEFAFRLDTTGSTLASGVSAGATSISITTASGPLWSTNSDDYPLSLSIGGIEVVATACSDPSSPQTVTVEPMPLARSSGAPISLWDPRPLGL